MTSKRRVTVTSLILVGGFLAHGIIHVARTMAHLRAHPSLDTYANEVGFQVLVFIIFYGFPWLVGGLVVLAVVSPSKPDKS